MRRIHHPLATGSFSTSSRVCCFPFVRRTKLSTIGLFEQVAGVDTNGKIPQSNLGRCSETKTYEGDGQIASFVGESSKYFFKATMYFFGLISASDVVVSGNWGKSWTSEAAINIA